MIAPATKESGNRGPASSAIWPVSANIPAPIITPVPMATPPARLIEPFSEGAVWLCCSIA